MKASNILNLYFSIRVFLTLYMIKAYQSQISLDSLNMNDYFDINSPEVNLSKEEIDILRKGFKCKNNKEDCSNNGICNLSYPECICYDDYTTYFTDILSYSKQLPRCNYKMKHRRVALLYAIIGFGLLDFYIGNYITGGLQLIVFILILSYAIYFIYSLSIKSIQNGIRRDFKLMLKGLIISVLLIFVFFWWLYGLLLVLSNLVIDENRVLLYPINYDIYN